MKSTTVIPVCRALAATFRISVKQLFSDAMLCVILAAPVLAGCFFRFVIPYLAGRFNALSLVSPYYQLFDVLLCILTPYMFCFSSGMILLGDRDDHIIASYAAALPGKAGYLTARLAFPAAAGTAASVLILLIFHLTALSPGKLVLLSFFSSLTALTGSLITVAAAGNRVEGMALAKMSGLIMCGVFLPYFTQKSVWMVFCWLPSTWIARYAQTGSVLSAVTCFAVSAVWIGASFYAFNRRYDI